MNLETIPLNKLVPAPCNVRKTGALAIDDLAASIAAHGLLLCGAALTYTGTAAPRLLQPVRSRSLGEWKEPSYQ